jgi:uncharacterized protein (DUF1015 family)
LADIRPFRAIRYTEKAGDLKNLILPLEENKYEVARQRIQQWMSEGVLAKDNEPTVFVSRQEFKLNGETCVRTGLIAALQLYAYIENIVFPHEVTYEEPKADRLNMLRTVQKDLEPVFMIYSESENRTIDFFADVTKTKPVMEVQDSFRVKHTLWKVTDPQKIRVVQEALKDKKLVITDGHHRYESAIAYRDERRRQGNWSADSAFNFHMCYMVPVQDEGVVVLPTHRLLKNFNLTNDHAEALKKFFSVTEINATVKDLENFLASNRDEHAFCVYTREKAYGLLLKHEKRVYEFVEAASSKETKLFDVVILHDVIFKSILKVGEFKMDEDILYVRWTRDAVEKVDKGEASVAFLVNPISPETVWQIAQQHERLPEKSTDFYPKPVSGLMMMDISPEEKL